ncbi:restriction endonuclease [Halomonas sp. AOP42-C1-46]|uniref:restriction endonuclease n=1 Tax=Halomonas sp. AOP42-C1-46 TaxID=3457671 RepID=UPI004033AA57
MDYETDVKLKKYIEAKQHINSLLHQLSNIYTESIIEKLRQSFDIGFSKYEEPGFTHYTDENLVKLTEVLLAIAHIFLKINQALHKIEAHNKDLITHFAICILSREMIDSMFSEDPSPIKETIAINSSILFLETFLIDDTLLYLDGLVNQIKESVRKKRHIVFERYKQLTKKDIYGFSNDELWHKERSKFIDNTLKEIGGVTNDHFKNCSRAITTSIINIHIEDLGLDPKEQEPATPSRVTNHKKGVDYEQECIEIFNDNGWTTMPTPVTGDMGADIIAIKRGLKVVAQCKNWSGKTNTKAVQEINTAKHYYEADVALIISETDQTRQSIEISSKLNVLSIRKEDIPELEVLIIKLIENL